MAHLHEDASEFLQFCNHPLLARAPHNLKPSRLRSAAHMREAEEVECLRFALSPSSTVLNSPATKLD